LRPPNPLLSPDAIATFDPRILRLLDCGNPARDELDKNQGQTPR
jgi:hypothetical protein